MADFKHECNYHVYPHPTVVMPIHLRPRIRRHLYAAGQRNILHIIIEPVDAHTPCVVVDIGKDTAKDADRIGGDGTEMAGMQVRIRGVDRHPLVHEALQLGGDGRLRWRPHLGVADESDVTFQFLAVSSDEVRQAGRTALLLALQQHDDVSREVNFIPLAWGRAATPARDQMSGFSALMATKR